MNEPRGIGRTTYDHLGRPEFDIPEYRCVLCDCPLWAPEDVYTVDIGWDGPFRLRRPLYPKDGPQVCNQCIQNIKTIEPEVEEQLNPNPDDTLPTMADVWGSMPNIGGGLASEVYLKRLRGLR